MPRLISRSELARLANVSRAAITKACNTGRIATDPNGRIDLDSPDVVDYLESKGVDPTSLAVLAFQQPKKPTGPRPDLRVVSDDDDDSDDDEEPEDEDITPSPARNDVPLDEIYDLTIREVVERFGTDESLVNYVKTLKIIEQTRWQRIKNEREEGRLIPKEFVKQHVLALIDGAFRGLLIDAPKTLARRLYAAAKADVPIEEGEATAKEINSSHIRAVKDRCRKALADDSD